MIQGVDGFPKQKEDESVEKTHQMDLQRWNRPVHDNASEIVNIAVDGVEKEQRLYILRKSGNSVENRGKIHQIANNQAVKILRIPKENMKRGKDISNSHIEEKQAENGITQTHPYDVRLNAVNQDNGEHDKHGQEEIDQAGDILGNHEQLLINADSGKDSDIGGESEHGLIGGVGEIMIYDIADNQITDEMFAPPEKIGEDHRLRCELNQRRKHTPDDAQKCPLIARLKITANELLQKKAALSFFLRATLFYAAFFLRATLFYAAFFPRATLSYGAFFLRATLFCALRCRLSIAFRVLSFLCAIPAATALKFY